MSIVEFIHNKIIELEEQNIPIRTKKLYEYYDECLKYIPYTKPESYTRTIRDLVSKYNEDTNDELINGNVTLAKQKQKHQDTNRIERKQFRNHARIDNALIEYNKDLIKTLKDVSNNFANICIKHEYDDSDVKGIIQISDTHANELINLPHNKFDFTEFSKRLKKLTIKSIKIFKDNNVNTVLIAMTGDLINSDRRLDELLNKATNRSRATILTSYLLSQMIIELNQHFKVCVTNVSGNESRVKDEHGYSEMVATDNYDWTIFEILNLLFDGIDDIEFMRIGYREGYINVNGHNILIMHGEYLRNTGIEKQIEQTVGRYTVRDVIIDYTMVGHLHSAKIGDRYARSSSMCGANDYSDNGLNLNGRASQNIFLVHKDAINGIRIDLQHTNGIKGYDIIKKLEEYNCKSHDKLNNYNSNHII